MITILYQYMIIITFVLIIQVMTLLLRREIITASRLPSFSFWVCFFLQVPLDDGMDELGVLTLFLEKCSFS